MSPLGNSPERSSAQPGGLAKLGAGSMWAATLRKSPTSVAELKKSSSSNRSARGGAYKDVDQVGDVIEQDSHTT